MYGKHTHACSIVKVRVYVQDPQQSSYMYFHLCGLRADIAASLLRLAHLFSRSRVTSLFGLLRLSTQRSPTPHHGVRLLSSCDLDANQLCSFANSFDRTCSLFTNEFQRRARLVILLSVLNPSDFFSQIFPAQLLLKCLD